MARNFTDRISFDSNVVFAVFVPQHRKDGMYYEVNIKGFPRFYVNWTALDRYDVVPEEGVVIPYELVLSVSDAIEKHEKR